MFRVSSQEIDYIVCIIILGEMQSYGQYLWCGMCDFWKLDPFAMPMPVFEVIERILRNRDH